MASERIGEFIIDGAVIPIVLDAPSGRLDLRIGDDVAFIALQVAHGMTVKPFCPLVAHYIKRHPEFQELVDATFSSASAASQVAGKTSEA
jgi:hypothetical protein